MRVLGGGVECGTDVPQIRPSPPSCLLHTGTGPGFEHTGASFCDWTSPPRSPYPTRRGGGTEGYGFRAASSFAAASTFAQRAPVDRPEGQGLPGKLAGGAVRKGGIRAAYSMASDICSTEILGGGASVSQSPVDHPLPVRYLTPLPEPASRPDSPTVCRKRKLSRWL